MNCKKKIDDAVARIIQCLKDECTIVPSPGWLLDEAIRTELAVIQQESTHLEEIITSTMDELSQLEGEGIRLPTNVLTEKDISGGLILLSMPIGGRC
ncbi:MAG: hypothetical protein V3S69_04840 [Dehalococcoidales bacterium]